jgi:hypothetical protein
MVVLYDGQIIPSREAPPRAAILRSGESKWNNVLPALPKCITDNFIYENITTEPVVERLPPGQIWQRKPSPRQCARWEVVQTCKRRGLSGRAIAKELHISRETVLKYLAADRPISNRMGQPLESANSANSPKILTNSLNNNTDVFP